MQPTHVGALPAQCAALNRTFLNVVELTVRAALEGRRDHVYTRRCSTRTPRRRSTSTRSTGCDELIAAHGDALPPALRSAATYQEVRS